MSIIYTVGVVVLIPLFAVVTIAMICGIILSMAMYIRTINVLITDVIQPNSKKHTYKE